jgi:hypothetical protein
MRTRAAVGVEGHAVAPSLCRQCVKGGLVPGIAIPPHSHPGPVALHGDQGTFGTELFDVTGAIQPAPVVGTPGS